MTTRSVVIFSTKGGVGKTLVAANLAVTLGLYLRKKAALIDLDLHAAGDMLRWLDIAADKSMLDFAENKEPELTRVPKYDIDFLPALQRPSQAGRLDAQKIKNTLDSLEGRYDFVVIDAGRAFSETMFSVFNHANLILLVVTPDILSVYQTKWSLDVLQSLHIPLNMIKIVLNRAESLGSVSWQEIRAAIPCEIISRVPSDGKAVGLALNRRVPLVIDNANCRASQAIRKLGAELVENEKIFLSHREAVPPVMTEEGLFARESEFWKKFKLDQGSFAQDAAEKEPDEIKVGISLKAAVNGFKTSFIAKTVESTGGNKKKAAEILKIQRTYLSNLIKSYL